MKEAKQLTTPELIQAAERWIEELEVSKGNNWPLHFLPKDGQNVEVAPAPEVFRELVWRLKRLKWVK